MTVSGKRGKERKARVLNMLSIYYISSSHSFFMTIIFNPLLISEPLMKAIGPDIHDNTSNFMSFIGTDYKTKFYEELFFSHFLIFTIIFNLKCLNCKIHIMLNLTSSSFLSVQFTSVKYIHIVLQPISRTPLIL